MCMSIHTSMHACVQPTHTPTRPYCLPAPPSNKKGWKKDKGYPDAYRGWYDTQGCGKCNDYCRWVGNSGAGGDPKKRTIKANSWWSCHIGVVTYSAKNRFGSKFKYGAHCSRLVREVVASS